MKILASHGIQTLISFVKVLWQLWLRRYSSSSSDQKVAGLISWLPWARYWTPNVSWWAGRQPAWQPLPSMCDCDDCCKAPWALYIPPLPLSLSPLAVDRGLLTEQELRHVTYVLLLRNSEQSCVSTISTCKTHSSLDWPITALHDVSVTMCW